MKTKPPFLVCFNRGTGIATRYVRMFDMSGAGLGWCLTKMQRATFDTEKGVEPDTLDRFRTTGVV